MAAGGHRLRVGIDFGTTFSGVAWTDTAKPDEVVLIKKWPGAARASEKVPSEITYTSTGEVHKWGFEIKPDEDRLAWFKLLLHPAGYSNSPSSTITRTKSLIPNPSTKKPVDIVADYLTCLRSHTIETIKRSYGKAFLDVTPIDYILTVPAIWSDAAKVLTLKAAESAGFGSRITLQLMSEPDAAAAWTLLRDVKPNTLKVHDAFVVVDCGGGTVDLISYEVATLEPTLTVKECAKGTGGLCGSTFLNGNFEALVRSRIGKRFDKMKSGARNRMTREFEEVLKRLFSDSEDDDIFNCPISGVLDDEAAGIEEGCLVITREEMKGIFDPIIKKIIILVQEQINMVESQANRGLRLSNVLLVGGFGSSKYLFQRLEAELKKGGRKKNSPVEILQPVNAWSAVARGAALGIRISSRTARRHYGTTCSTRFIFGKHPINNLFYCPYDGEAYSSHWMEWYIKEGEQVSEEKPKSIRLIQSAGINDSMIITGTLYKCDQESAPEFSNQGGSCIEELCTLTTDLSMVPRNLFVRKIGTKSVPYYEIHYNLVMTVKSAMIIDFHVEFNGKKYKSVTAEYKSD